ncbi:response regulator CelR2 [Rhodopirellula maiorica SM1]|uniref:Response regulator CelR2 n=1 Tax=Rhodopirellula maiorica SM1 TaxID=1265738 RepID=M5RZM8_9BACT|nr:response regulator CelR2 [Rhodopirellula maiorica SM1]
MEVRASLLGCTVACQHCHAEFVASTRDESAPQAFDRSLDLLQRVESALRRAEQQPSTSASQTNPVSETV